MPQGKIIANNFMDMVASLPATKLDTFYHNAVICEAILSKTHILGLQKRYHPFLKNVTDQIRLWETDLNSVETTVGHFYPSPSKEVFEAACDCARREHIGLLWEESEAMRLISLTPFLDNLSLREI